MSAIERLTITLPADMAGMVKGAVSEGDYASTSEVIRDALRDWRLKRELRLRQLAELKTDIDLGMAAVAEGRVYEWNVQEIVTLGKKMHAARVKSPSRKIG
jgi:antitoxin ParD1/3/4